jgi:TolB-like protein
MMVGVLVAWALYPSGPVAAPGVRVTHNLHVVSAPAATASVLWVLSIGVSHYRQADFGLRFAASDARAVAAALATQGAGPLYAQVKTLVLTDEDVTRESILDSMDHFLGQAGPNDVAAIFVAGHGVQDRAGGGYYFLPFPTTAENLITTGLRMSDFDQMVRVVRHKVRAIVVMLDTCHAGALQFGSSPGGATDEPAAWMSSGDGLFLIAATRPGEQSQESPELAHGAFTYALLEGLQGAAHADKDGLLSVSDLFGYVAREVPRVTGGMQHPYHRTEGSDLSFAAVMPGTKLITPALVYAAGAQAASAHATASVPNTIGVMEFRNVRADPEHDWVGTALRLAFNTELSKVRALKVYAPELIDRTTKNSGADQLDTAKRLGIDRLITGSFSVVGSTILIDARIVNAGTGLQEGSDSVQGSLAEFFNLQKKLVLSLLRRLRVRLSPEEGTSIQNPTNTDVDAYRLLLETEEALEEAQPPPLRSPTPKITATVPQPQSRLERRGLGTGQSGLDVNGLVQFLLSAIAYAAEPQGAAESDVRQLLEEYRRALEQKDPDRLADLYVSFSAHRRDALREYFNNADDFTVELADVIVTPRGNEMTVSYTRRDRFVDKGTSKPVSLEVRLTRIVVREGGKWKIAGRP